jgi:phosphoglycolate phosphatase-like HAD superfamily hydrolase
VLFRSGYVPKNEILDEFGYKAQYNEALMEVVQGRMDKVRKGELQLEDVTVKGAVSLLEFLRERGVTLFLASGTDEEDVLRETELLGYKNYFNGGIWGAQNNLAHEPKKVVLENILNEIGRQHAGRIITFGDGPVEIRETAKAGGFTVGVASNEVQRFGLNEVKRKRLVLAGADIVIPDYSQLEILKTFIF